jgi:Ca-activated chloride channel family protein
LILALTSTALAGDQAASPVQPNFATSVTQIEVYATVTEAGGKAVRDLQQGDFTILENGVRQEITTFASGEFPVSVALAIDRSFSMRGAALTMAKTAGRAFVSSLKATDRAMLISISGNVEVLAPPSADKAPMLQALSALDPWSTTSLHDAIVKALDLIENEPGRRAIVILSDGADRYSSATVDDVIQRARRSDVLMYPIAIGKLRPPLFAELAQVTGGQAFYIREPKALGPTLQAIGDDLRSQYLLGYSPSVAWPGQMPEWRSINVNVNRAGASVRARSGYSTK